MTEIDVGDHPEGINADPATGRVYVADWGDNRLTVMAGIAVLDELAEANRRIADLQRDVASLTEAGEALSLEAEELERKFAKRLNEAARKVEAIATVIEETGAAAAN